MGKVFLFLVLIISISLSSKGQSDFIKEYILTLEDSKSMDGYQFYVEEDGSCNFSFNKRKIDIKLSDSIPIEKFNYFISNILYPKRPIMLMPIMLFQKGELNIDSIAMSDVGIVNRSNLKCNPMIVPILKIIRNESQIEFLILHDYEYGIYVESYIYDKFLDRIISYVPIFKGVKLGERDCLVMDFLDVAVYQTLEIKGGEVSQLVNDGFNDEWLRKLKINEDGYYEIILQNNPFIENPLFEAEISDPDGFTNVRMRPSTKSQVIYEIREKEIFVVEEMPDLRNWFKIYNYRGKSHGWIHKSRVIKLEKVKPINDPLKFN